MDWIFDHFQIVVLIALGLASWAKRRMDAKRAEQEERPSPGDMAEDGDDDIFGPGKGWEQPMPSVPPPLVRQVPPPLMRESGPPPQHTREHESEVILKRQLDMQERLRQIKESKTTTTGGAAATNARVAASQSNAKAFKPAKANLRGDLRNPKQIRRAIVMREILGPPVALR